MLISYHGRRQCLEPSHGPSKRPVIGGSSLLAGAFTTSGLSPQQGECFPDLQRHRLRMLIRVVGPCRNDASRVRYPLEGDPSSFFSWWSAVGSFVWLVCSVAGTAIWVSSPTLPDCCLFSACHKVRKHTRKDPCCAIYAHERRRSSRGRNNTTRTAALSHHESKEGIINHTNAPRR